MRIAIAQIDTLPGAFDRTVDRMVEQSQRAAERKAELLVFPLAALAGVDVVSFADRISYMRDIATALSSLSDRLACPALVPIPVDLGTEESYFEVILLDGGSMTPLNVLARDRQTILTGRADGEVLEFTFAGKNIALALSQLDLDDLCDYDYTPDVVIYFAGYPFALDDSASAMGLNLAASPFVADARTINAYLVGVSSVGGYGEGVFAGGSFVLAPSGELIAAAPGFEEALISADVSPEQADEPRDAFDSLSPEVFDAPFVLWQAICLGIHDFVEKNGYTDVALCLDGTMAASVLAALASDALGPLHVHVLVGASAGAQAASCRELAHRLGVYETTASGAAGDLDPRDVDELELAVLAREHHALVLSSLDKTALALCPRQYRVSAAQLCPLGDVYRSDVLDMAHMRNTISPLFRRVALTEADAFAVPMEQGQHLAVDEQSTLTVVDELLLSFVEHDRSLAALVADGIASKEVAMAVLSAKRGNELSRRTAPPVLAMSLRTLDDARLPLGMQWHDTHLDETPFAPEAWEGLEEKLAREAPKKADVDAQQDSGPLPSSAPDLDGTLAMLRDLAEQGGFAPSELAAIGGLSGEDLAQAFNRLQGSSGVISPFSEN